VEMNHIFKDIKVYVLLTERKSMLDEYLGKKKPFIKSTRSFRPYAIERKAKQLFCSTE
jgi:hypothetical protein